jgi:murein DD-endopeptidase MepM/ murein hydrolase activator NlpD
MSTDNNNQESWSEKLQHTYRLVVMNDETFEEVGSYRLTRLNIYLLASSIIVATAFFVILFIIITPVKEWIPGYGDVNLRDNMEELAQQVQELQERQRADSTYIASVQRFFSVDYQTEEGVPKIDTTQSTPDSLLNIDRIEEDEELRNLVDKNEPLIVPDEVAESGEGPQPVKFGPSSSGAALEQLYLVAPVRGQISNGFRQDKGHYGTDLMAPKNTPIKAVLDGTVIQSDWTLEAGRTIAIQHSNNVVSYYKHNSSLLKKVGDSVKAGEAIAIIGNTGTLSSGPHLHFELWFDGKPVDPADYVSFN